MSDIAINPINTINKPSSIGKQSHLITMEGTNSKSKYLRFVTLDKPDIEGYYIRTKGIFVSQEEDEIINSYQDLLTNANKESIIEIMVPWVRVFNIRSLIFRAK